MIDYTKLKDTNRRNLIDIIPLSKPFTLVIEPSSLCNFKCGQCFQSVKGPNYFTEHKKNMDMELFSRIVEQMAEWGGDKLKVVKLSLYGEPLLNHNFCDMLRLVKDARIAERVETTSNVSLLTPEICERMVKDGLDYIRVSVYSPVQEKHEAITGSAMDIRDIHGNLSVLREVKSKLNSETPFVAVKMLDTYSEENDLFMKMYGDVADELYIEKPHNWIANSERNFVEALYGDGIGKAMDDLNKQVDERRACGISFYTLSVRNNGDVSPCCVDWIGGTNVSNIYDMSLREIWQGRPVRDFWRMQLRGENHTNPSCGNCEIYKSSYYSKDNVDGFPPESI